MKKQRNLNSLQTRSRRIWAMRVLGVYPHEEIAALRRSTAATGSSAIATADTDTAKIITVQPRFGFRFTQ